MARRERIFFELSTDQKVLLVKHFHLTYDEHKQGSFSAWLRWLALREAGLLEEEASNAAGT